MADRDRGVTLIEVVIALSLLGFALVSLLGGLGSTAMLSVSAAEQGRADGALRAAVATLEGLPFVPCATTYVLGPAATSSVSHWSGSGWSSACTGSPPQRVTITVNGRTLEVVKTNG